MSGKQIAANETAAATLVQHADGWVLTTIPGVNNLLVACYLAAIGGDILRFPTAAHLWSYAGFDPIECDSGNHLGTGLISKQGSPYLHTVLFQMVFLASTNHPGSARVYVRARQRGLQETPAVIHVAHYLNTVCFAILCNQLEPHLYQYARNNPINFVDPSGLLCVGWVWGDQTCRPVWDAVAPGQSYLDATLQDAHTPSANIGDTATREAALFVVGLGQQGAYYVDEHFGTHMREGYNLKHSIVVDKNGEVLNGNHRLQVVKDLGYDEIPARVLGK